MNELVPLGFGLLLGGSLFFARRVGLATTGSSAVCRSRRSRDVSDR